MIRGVTGVGGVGSAAPLERAGALGGGGGFAEAFESAVRAVDASQAAADDKLRGVATGQSADLHGTMIALEEANIALRAMGSVRDKLVEGWQTVWNMPV